MKKFRLAITFFVSTVFLSFPSVAQPTIAANGIRNSASYALPGLPNSGMGQGSIFVIFG